MTDLSITEATSVQFPMIRHVAAVGWTPLAPHAALRKRGGEAGTLVRDEVEAALGRFNPWLPADAIRAVIEKIEALRCHRKPGMAVYEQLKHDIFNLPASS